MVQKLTDVCVDDVDNVVADFASEGAEVARQPQSNGKFTVVATFRDLDSDNPSFSSSSSQSLRNAEKKKK